MKVIVLNIFILIGSVIVAHGQESDLNIPVDEKTGIITYQEVVEVEGTRSELFNRSVYWMNDFYTNPVAVTKVRDKGSGVVKGQHQFRIHYTDNEGYKKDAGLVMYDFIIELKEGRYRYTVTDFVLRKASRYPVEQWLNKSDPLYNERWDEYLRQIDSFMRDQWISSLKDKMLPPEVIEEEEW